MTKFPRKLLRGNQVNLYWEENTSGARNIYQLEYVKTNYMFYVY